MNERTAKQIVERHQRRLARRVKASVDTSAAQRSELAEVGKAVNAWSFENPMSGPSRNGPAAVRYPALSTRPRQHGFDVVEHGSQSSAPLTQRARNPRAQPQGCQTLTENVRIRLRFQKAALAEHRLVENPSNESKILVTENDKSQRSPVKQVKGGASIYWSYHQKLKSRKPAVKHRAQKRSLGDRPVLNTEVVSSDSRNDLSLSTRLLGGTSVTSQAQSKQGAFSNSQSGLVTGGGDRSEVSQNVFLGQQDIAENIRRIALKKMQQQKYKTQRTSPRTLNQRSHAQSKEKGILQEEKQDYSAQIKKILDDDKELVRILHKQEMERYSVENNASSLSSQLCFSPVPGMHDHFPSSPQRAFKMADKIQNYKQIQKLKKQSTVLVKDMKKEEES